MGERRVEYNQTISLTVDVLGTVIRNATEVEVRHFCVNRGRNTFEFDGFAAGGLQFLVLERLRWDREKMKNR